MKFFFMVTLLALSKSTSNAMAATNPCAWKHKIRSKVCFAVVFCFWWIPQTEGCTDSEINRLTIYGWGDSRIPGIGNSGDRWSAQKNWTVRYSCRTQGPQQHLTRATASQNASAPASPELPQA